MRLNIMSPSAGHTTLELSTQEVQEKFEELTSHGYLGFSGGMLVTTVDDSIQELTMSPVVVAG